MLSSWFIVHSSWREVKRGNLKNCLVVLFFVFFIAGCSSTSMQKTTGTVKEVVKGIWGVSTKQVEDSRKSALVKTFQCDYNSCFQETVTILQRKSNYIYAKDIKKQMIAIYVSQEDTTPVGIFFKAIGPFETQVEVASPSTYAKEFIAKNLFIGLDKIFSKETKKEIEPAVVKQEIQQIEKKPEERETDDKKQMPDQPLN